MVLGMRKDFNEMKSDIHDIKEGMQDVVNAFPGGDTAAHKRYHDAIIERNHELRKLTLAIREKTILGVFWLALGLIGTALWFYICAKLAAPIPSGKVQ